MDDNKKFIALSNQNDRRKDITMKKTINADLAGKILLSAFGLLLVLHILIIAQILPADFVWGGQVKTDGSNLMQLEIVAITLTLFFAGIVAAKNKSLQAKKPNILITIGMWVVFAYLVLNTLGNFASGVRAETLFFAPLTIVMALCAFRLAIEK
jgi:hypothetical protein